MAHTINGTTLDFLKRMAKNIKKQTGIKHTEALEQAAGLYGFFSYKDCINQFKALENGTKI